MIYFAYSYEKNKRQLESFACLWIYDLLYRLKDFFTNILYKLLITFLLASNDIQSSQNIQKDAYINFQTTQCQIFKNK